MVTLWFDDYDGPKNLGDFGDVHIAWKYMVYYLKNYGNLNYDPYYYNVHQYNSNKSGESGIQIDYGSHVRFFRMVNAKMSDFETFNCYTHGVIEED